MVGAPESQEIVKLLITGASGQLGTDLVLSAQKSGHEVIATGHSDLDITDKSLVGRVIGDAKVDAIILLQLGQQLTPANQTRRKQWR